MKLVDLRLIILTIVFLLLWPLKAISQNLAKKKIFPQQRNYQKIDNLISKFTDNLMYVAITRAIQQLTFIGAPFSCLRLPGDELEIEESYAPGLHGLVVADETEREGEIPALATLAAGQEPTREKPGAPAAADRVEQQTAEPRRA